jgi:hypothetical protein
MITSILTIKFHFIFGLFMDILISSHYVASDG